MNISHIVFSDEVSSLLKKLFKDHTAKEPTEVLVKAAAEGNLKEIENLCKNHENIVSILTLTP